MKSKEQPEHTIVVTYVTLRRGIAILGIALPFVLWIGGHIRAALPLQQSMSAYYHSGGGAMRDEFVGILFAVGIFLYLYKGVTYLEDYALDLAGAFAVAVAIFPMQWGCGNSCSKVSLHGTFAVLFFLCIAYVCIFRASDTLSWIKNDAKVQRYKRAYTLIGLGMIASPLIAVVLTSVLQPDSKARATLFFVEAVGVFMFALYWLVKTQEIAKSNFERDASEGKLTIDQYGIRHIFKQITVRPVPQD